MDIKTISLWVCIIIVVLSSIFFGIQKIRESEVMWTNFSRWGYSKLFMKVLGVVEIATAIGLLFQQTRMCSIYVYGIIVVGAIGTHLKAKDKKQIDSVLLHYSYTYYAFGSRLKIPFSIIFIVFQS